MLLNRDTAEGIANGSITLVLRAWDVPRAKAGGTQRTVAGTIRIDDVAEFPGGHRVTAAQARAAGYPDAATAQKDLDRRPARHTYAIAVSFLAPDERPDLAADDQLVSRRCRCDRRAPGPLGCGHRAVDEAVPADDRRQRGGACT